MNKVFSISLLLLFTTSLPAAAGQVVVRKSSEPFDAFAVRDQVLADHEWQEALRFQQQIQILQALPMGCLPVAIPYRHFTCRGQFYRPYEYQNKHLYIEIEQPQKVTP
ncbi:hypothetical protein L2729_16425 [Shewanella gelidimarina]|uniref:hypothetical protein n=1 Tax=Shewanella gelidimarina TaxID=56813 RepID=UPI00200FC3CC|nr:hypothetical protein [Shewanella gelidimarina]MCL1059558.1 hypothetical protein [Shewanella gelidimarina]